MDTDDFCHRLNKLVIEAGFPSADGPIFFDPYETYTEEEPTVLQRAPQTLQVDSITFGKYTGKKLSEMLRDRKYCSWLLKQEWFPKQYEYLYNRVAEHDPRKKFLTRQEYKIPPTGGPVSGPVIGSVEPLTNSVEDFLQKYHYFHLKPVKEIQGLSEVEKNCYKFYLSTVRSLRKQIEASVSNQDSNPFDIKAPTSWLKKFEQEYKIPRETFKEFLAVHELPNIPYIVEDIKKMGGIEYKGARSYLIAKQKSLDQEKFWEDKLKILYGEGIASQFKYKSCIFDFIGIRLSTLYECKLNIKDFDQSQYDKYQVTLGQFHLVYLIGTDCIIDLDKKTVFTTNPDKYREIMFVGKNPSKFDLLIQNFSVVKLGTVEEYFQGQK